MANRKAYYVVVYKGVNSPSTVHDVAFSTQAMAERSAAETARKRVETGGFVRTRLICKVVAELGVDLPPIRIERLR